MSKDKETLALPPRGILLVVIFFLFVLVLTFLFGDRGIIEIVKSKRELRRLDQTIRSLEAEKSTLQVEVEQLRSSPQAIEKKAREKLWLMKKNEKVVVFDPNDKKEKKEKKE